MRFVPFLDLREERLIAERSADALRLAQSLECRLVRIERQQIGETRHLINARRPRTDLGTNGPNKRTVTVIP
jgi:hypothetical protein